MHHFVDHGNHPQTGTIVPCPNCSNGAPPDQSSRESYSRRKGREQPTDRATRVLVVDDEIDGRNALVQLLSLSGFVINCLQSGAAALLEPSLSTYDVIVLDLHLPDILGLTLLSEWRRRGVTAPVIVMTGWYGEAGHEHAARSLGAAAFMRKPLDATNLQAEIASAISGKTPRAIVPYVVHNDRHGSLSSVAAYRNGFLTPRAQGLTPLYSRRRRVSLNCFRSLSVGFGQHVSTGLPKTMCTTRRSTQFKNISTTRRAMIRAVVR